MHKFCPTSDIGHLDAISFFFLELNIGHAVYSIKFPHLVIYRIMPRHRAIGRSSLDEQGDAENPKNNFASWR
jgi:hypothetical protein